MTGIFSKLWPGFALAIILLLGVLLLEKSCNKPTVVDTSATKMTQVKQGYDSAAAEYIAQVNALKDQRDSLTDVVDSLLARDLMMQYALDMMGDTVKNTLAALDRAKVLHDTIPILINCDSLEQEVKRGLPAVKGFEEISDSVIKAATSQAIVQDSMIAKLARLNSVASETITAQQLQYQILHKDDQSKTAQLKIYKPVALGGVALAAVIIALKFILK